MTKRNPYWQVIRGICALAVIMIHCPSGASFPIGSTTFNMWLVLRQALNFPVAVFFFMAGYFVNIDKCEKNPSEFKLTRGGVLLIPYIFWTLFYSLISIIGDVLSGDRIEVGTYLYKAIVGGAAAPLSYIICLFQLTLLTPLLIKILKKKGAAQKVVWCITPIHMAFIYAWFIVDADAFFLQGTLKSTLFTAWILFYYLGLNYKMNPEKLDRISERAGFIWTVVIAFALECVEAFAIVNSDLGSGFAGSQFKVSSFLFAFCVCLCVVRRSKETYREKRVGALLHHIGDRSYGVFYIHCFILMVLTKVYNYVGISDIWILNFIICFIMTALLSVLAVDIVNVLVRKLKIETALKWIGFERSI